MQKNIGNIGNTVQKTHTLGTLEILCAKNPTPVGNFGLKMCHGSIPHVLLCPIYQFCLTLDYNCNDNKKCLLCCAIVSSKELAHISRSPCVIFSIYLTRKLLEGIKFAKWPSVQVHDEENQPFLTNANHQAFSWQVRRALMKALTKHFADRAGSNNIRGKPF